MTALYDRIGQQYPTHRQTDARIAAMVHNALGTAQTVLNVGAGTGSYEPADRRVIALEPAMAMLTQRHVHAAAAVQGIAESLPFPDNTFDAVMGILTLHHWTDQQRGLAECMRVARETVVLLTWDAANDDFWLVRDYFPELLARDRVMFPSLHTIANALHGAEVRTIPIPADCNDGFLGAYWKRPEAYLDVEVRNGMSAFAQAGDIGAPLDRLRADIESKVWHRRNAALMKLESLDVGYRLVVARAERLRNARLP